MAVDGQQADSWRHPDNDYSGSKGVVAMVEKERRQCTLKFSIPQLECSCVDNPVTEKKPKVVGLHPGLSFADDVISNLKHHQVKKLLSNFNERLHSVVVKVAREANLQLPVVETTSVHQDPS